MTLSPKLLPRRRRHQRGLSCSCLAVSRCGSMPALTRCGGHVVTVQGPAKVVDKGRYGPGFLAHVIATKCADSLALYRLEKQYRRMGIPVACSTTSLLKSMPLWVTPGKPPSHRPRQLQHRERRDRVANELGPRRASRRHVESEEVRECLQPRCLMRRDCPRLSRVNVATLPHRAKARRDGLRRTVPPHAPVDALVAVVLVTVTRRSLRVCQNERVVLEKPLHSCAVCWCRLWRPVELPRALQTS